MEDGGLWANIYVMLGAGHTVVRPVTSAAPWLTGMPGETKQLKWPRSVALDVLEPGAADARVW